MDMRLEFSTDGVSEENRFEQWSEITREHFAGLTSERTTEKPFFGRLRAHTVGRLPVMDFHAAAHRVCLNARDIARGSREAYLINLQVSGTSTMRQGGTEHRLAPGDFGIIDLTRPGEVHFEQEWQGVTLALPHHVLQPRLRDRDMAAGLVVRGAEGAGALASAYLGTFARMPPPTGSTAEAVGNILVDLLAVAVGATAEAREAAAPGVLAARRQAVCDYLERHLGDPDLDPASVASAFRMSTRYLHELFEPTGETLMRRVLSHRLERCRQDLAAPAMRSRTIADIAFGWGFRDLSHFGRVFKAAHGMTPREWRKQALASGALPVESPCARVRES
ncbi:helix-turn-helix domain-containing protein [Pyxidicoccus fallax]|uniref:Helix-turn-helix domain-containing protein n=1 Tax=Pyxidicoccus fallax TaxID=394095 RepID=A0A848LVG0_9BACT|nr:helix-turn-helix domain-containing protein [Pyxidicoccus fallax]NMO22068.1 helix-turn-helix domain-containing protein [Pyxidicoccus fallax]NPC83602.1 helix-turn-helix domain-containing protein [Pyxidicoccus fallax]